MIGKLFYLCPSCLSEDTLIQKSEYLFCLNCNKSYPFKNNRINYNENEYTLTQFYHLLRSLLSLNVRESDKVFRRSESAILRQGIDRVSFHGRNKLKAIIEAPVEVDRGHFEISRDSLVFHGSNKRWQFSKDHVSGYTTNSKYFEFKIKGLPFFQIYFEKESPLKYEDLLTDWFEKDPLDEKIIEHQPKLINKVPGEPSLLLHYKEIASHEIREKFSIPEFILHLFVGLPIVTFLRLYSNLTLSNRQLIPKKGPFILIMNHESYLDPIIISTILPRRIAFFTKSTSFADKLLQPIFRAYRSLPNRRYETDPQVVRHSLRVLKKGECIGIFPEGERTWNGELLPFKYNTIKYLLSVQVPIVVASIKGAYKVLPRWTHKIHSGKIDINVQTCFSLIPGKWNIEDLKRELESYFQEI